MTKEQKFLEYLVAEYTKDGWSIVSLDEAQDVLSFTPDIVLKRGGEHLVVDVKAAGYRESRALNVLRKIVESNEGWKLEVKVIPDDWGLEERPTSLDEVDERIAVAKGIWKEGHYREAYILLWTAAEAILRANDTDKVKGSAGLIRESYENGRLSASTLKILEKGFKARSRLVHGVSVPVSNQELDELMSAVSDLRHFAPSHAA